MWAAISARIVWSYLFHNKIGVAVAVRTANDCKMLGGFSVPLSQEFGGYNSWTWFQWDWVTCHTGIVSKDRFSLQTIIYYGITLYSSFVTKLQCAASLNKCFLTLMALLVITSDVIVVYGYEIEMKAQSS